LPPIIFLKWKKNLDQGALTQRVQDAATDTEISQPGKAQDVRKEEVFITTEMTKVKAQKTDRAEVLEAHATEETDHAEVLEAHVREVTDHAEVLEAHATEVTDHAEVLVLHATENLERESLM